MIYGRASGGNVRLLVRMHDRRTIGIVKLLSSMPAICEGTSYPDGPYRIEAVRILDDLCFQRRRLADDTGALEADLGDHVADRVDRLARQTVFIEQRSRDAGPTVSPPS